MAEKCICTGSSDAVEVSHLHERCLALRTGGACRQLSSMAEDTRLTLQLDLNVPKSTGR